MATRRILLVDDDREVRDLVEARLRDAGYAVQPVADGESALAQALHEPFDLIILDLMLPRIGGLEICRVLRLRGVQTPVLMVTAKASAADRVTGLDLGADDYLPKPFAVGELLARVRAMFRRVEAIRSLGARGAAVIRAGAVRLDLDSRRVTVDGRPVDLTAKEFDLLALLARHPGRVYSREQLLDLVWGYRHEGSGHTVNSHINRLRAKLEPDLRNPRFVETVRGVGYRFSDVAIEPASLG